MMPALENADILDRLSDFLQWEYVKVAMPPVPYKPALAEAPRDEVDMLNEYGSKGWELVQVVGYVAYLKRRKGIAS